MTAGELIVTRCFDEILVLATYEHADVVNYWEIIDCYDEYEGTLSSLGILETFSELDRVDYSVPVQPRVRTDDSSR